MKKSWILEAARQVDSSKKLVILENPEARNYLDNLVIKQFWPVILPNLQNSNYRYFPVGEPEIKLDLSYTLQRSLTFMLFDENTAFFRGKFDVSLESWMIESEFFLGLAKDNDPKILFEILGNSHLAGNPPSLIVVKGKDDYFQITFHGGSGAGWLVHSEDEIKEKLKEVIEVNTQLYNFSRSRYLSEADFGKFMNLAYSIYEAY